MKILEYNVIIWMTLLSWVVVSCNNFFVEGGCSSAIVHQYLPGLQMVSPMNHSETRYLAFPELLFDFNSPIPGSHSICTENNRTNTTSSDLIFSPGNVNQYSFECKIVNPFLLSRLFLYNINLHVDWKTQEECQCVFPSISDAEASRITGFIISISVTPIGFAEIFYSIDTCQVNYILSDRALQVGDIFTQTLILDGGPKFLSGSVYLFIGMGTFSVLVAVFLIAILKSIYYNPSQAEQLSLEFKSLSLEYVSINEEERQKDFLAKIDELLR